MGKSDEQMRRAAVQWRKTMDAIRDPVALLAVDRSIVRCNESMRALVGKPWEHVIGRDCCSALHGVDEPPPECPTRRAETSRDRESWRTTVGDRWFDIIADPVLDEDGRVAGFVHVMADITERKRAEEALAASEQRYRTLIEGAGEGILVADADTHVFRYANPAICRMLGYSAEELLELRVTDLIPEGSLTPETLEALARAEPAWGRSMPMLCKDGRVIHADVGTASTELDGRPCLVGYFTDLTEKTQLEATKDKLEARKGQLEAQLRQAQRMESVGRLAGGVAHDFNNLLSVINGYAESILADLSEHDPMRDDVLEIKGAADRATSLTRQLLAFSRKQHLEPEVLDLNDVVSGIDSMLRRLLGDAIAVVTRLAEGLGSVEADRGQVEQVIMNLAVNARDAMPGGGQLRIRTENADIGPDEVQEQVELAEGPHVMLSVSDSGAGMDRTTLERAFEPFYTTKAKGKGTGLGLSTVYGIVKQSGGHIWVSSQPGRGTTFKICLPRTDATATAQAQAPRDDVEAGHETVLLVEDDDAVRKLTDRLLRRAGYDVLAAANGGEALLTCERHEGEIHLLLSDVVMPRMSGPELAERLSRLRPQLKALFMSGNVGDAVESHGAPSSGARLLAKPVTAEELLRKVREVLDQE